MLHHVRTACLLSMLAFFGALPASAAEKSAPPARSFRDCKTWFQTNVAYDPRLAIATDAVVVHRHGEALEPLKQAIGSWKTKGFVVGRMFFSDSDATLNYWKGKWDGQPHDDEVEKDAAGNPVLCSGFRPYMLPTEGWTRHLEEMTRVSIEAGADAILPEEPLAHSFTGYEAAFKPLFEKRFGIPWQPESASPEAHFLTCQLKTELYLQLEQRLARLTREEAAKRGRDIAFVVPVHGLYSNRASQLVAPMGMASVVPEFDGFVGQVWTGPVNWALANYSSPDKSFFSSAYALYDYFAALTAGSQKTMWMLADPVEDDPNHTWAEFEQWYRHCLAAKLMFPGIDTYEVMPWPDRIFLPGGNTGGSTPAPEKYRIALLSAIQVLQDVSADPADASAPSPGSRIDVAIGDSALWESSPAPVLDGLYGLMLPAIAVGIRPTVTLTERWQEPGYLDRSSVIVLSYENFKPAQPEQNTALVAWVQRGGVLLVLGAGGELKGDAFWWTRLQQASPLHHLLGLMSMDAQKDADQRVGKGWVMRRTVSPREAGRGGEGAKGYIALLADAAGRAGAAAGAAPPRPGFVLSRGRFKIVHAAAPMNVGDHLLDVLDPDLPVKPVSLKAGESGVYVDLERLKLSSEPQVLHCTHRLMEHSYQNNTTRMVMRGPAQTPAAARLFTAGRALDSVSARAAQGEPIAVESLPDPASRTVLLRFPNVPEGVTVTLRWHDGP